MDVTILLTIAALITILIIIFMLLIRRYTGRIQEEIPNVPEPAVQAQQVRRAVGVRNVRHRAHASAYNQANQDQDRLNDTDETNQQIQLPDYKIGAKKRAKLTAKAEKKIQREAAEHEREIRKKQEEERQKEKDRQHELELAEELRQEEAERKAREEKERKEHEEYLKMKEAFSVEEEGYTEENEQNEGSLLAEFIEYIKEEKVVFLDSLADRFSLKTESVVKRILELQASNDLTGVIDDRGKFIYISESELEAVKKFVLRRGRVSITELAENSSKLINLTPLSTSASPIDTA